MNNRDLVLTQCIVLVSVLSYVVFLYGFFPVKASIANKATATRLNISHHILVQPEKKLKRLVLVLIDALRADFVNDNSHLPFVREHITAGYGHNFIVKTHPPTVTLPRIKALTSGSIPGFIDVVLNFDSQSLLEDNVISQMYSNQERLVFYGDDTWIKLFPDHFIRSEGTTSFFVTDYTEVDDNVTRHLNAELSQPDWDMMILHYLGLDHIGHTAGPRSPLIPSKLREMDNIIKQIYTTLQQQDESFVVLVCGDHGMSDQGGHGGASDSEIFVPAVFLSPMYKRQDNRWGSGHELLQIDLAPTLSVMMGIPIPSNNLGQVLLETLGNLSDTDKLATLFINAHQIVRLMQHNVANYKQEPSFELYEYAVTQHEACLTKQHCTEEDFVAIFRSYEAAMEAMSNKIASSLTTYDLYCMVLAITLLLLCLLTIVLSGSVDMSLVSYRMSSVGYCVLSVFMIFCHMMACTSQSFHSSAMCGRSIKSVTLQIFVSISCIMLLSTLWSVISASIRYKTKLKLPAWMKLCLWVGTVLHSLSFGSSSFVEEEHQTWYHLTMSAYLIFLANACYCHVKAVVTDGHQVCALKKYDQAEAESNCSNICSSEMYAAVSDTGRFRQNGNKNKFHEEEDIDKQVVRVRKLQSLPVNLWLPWKQGLALVVIMFLGRIMRTVNQTGNKWLDTPDLGDFFIRPDNKGLLTGVTVLSLVVILLLNIDRGKFQIGCFLVGLVGCYQYRVVTQTVLPLFTISGSSQQLSKGTLEARVVFGVSMLINMIAIIQLIRRRETTQSKPNDQIIALNKNKNTDKNGSVSVQQYRVENKNSHISVSTNTCSDYDCIKTFQLSWVLLITLLLRTHNTALVAMVILQDRLLWEYVFKNSKMTPSSAALFLWWMGQACFFQQGNSNSISTVDVSAGYVGLTDYQPVAVSLLLFCSTYAMPVYWLLSLAKYVLYWQGSRSNSDYPGFKTCFLDCIQTLATERILTLLLYCAIVTTQRYHLFVWTVFSPKLLYEGMLTVMFSLFVIVFSIIGYCFRS